MTAAGLALVVALAAPLPEGTARWRFELAGEHVGAVELAIRCGAGACRAVWTSERLAPSEAGGTRSSRRVEVEVDREGRWRGGPLRVADDGRALAVTGSRGAVPSVLAEVVVLAMRDARRGEAAHTARLESCLDVFEEASGAVGKACARRDGDALAADVLGAAERIVAGPGGFPGGIDISSQGARFVRDDAAEAPREPPRLHGMVVGGPAHAARASSFCGVGRDPERQGQDLSRLPPPRAEGESCREKTALWLEHARRAGFEGRTAVGVAWDGGRYVWHAWPEVRLGRAWVPVDPSFEQAPARGPRFTLATYREGDEAAKRRAGERILACWGKARVR